MNEIVNKFLLAGDKLMPEMHLKQPGFTYSACGPFTKNKEGIQKFTQTGNTDCIYKNDLDKACFQHDMAYGKYKDLNKRTQSDKVLRNKYQRWISKRTSFKKSKGSGIKSMQNQQLANELINQLLENLKKEKLILHLKRIFRV